MSTLRIVYKGDCPGIINIIVLLIWEFFSLVSTDGFSMVSEWKQISRTLLSILADLNNADFWMVSSSSLIFKSSIPCTSPFDDSTERAN